MRWLLVAVAPVVAASACGALPAVDIDDGPDAASTDASSDVGSRDGSPFGDAATSEDADAACPVVLHQSFDLGALPSDWNVFTDGSGSVSIDTGKSLSAPGSLAARVDPLADGGNAGGGFVELDRLNPVTSTPSSVTLAYSVYLKDWPSGAVQPGCLLELRQGGLTLEQIRLQRDELSHAYSVALGGPDGDPSRPLFDTLPGEGWYDVTMLVTGFAEANLEVSLSMQQHAPGAATFQAMIVGSFPAAATTSIDVHCGLTSVDFTSSSPNVVDTWIDDVSLSICP